MRVAYVHGFAGIRGSLLLGALIDAGVPLSTVQTAWQQVQLPEAQVGLQRQVFKDYTATRVDLALPPLDTILAAYTEASLHTFLEQHLPTRTVQQSVSRVLERFVDAVADVNTLQVRDAALQSAWMPMVFYMAVGVVTGLEALGIEQVVAAPINLGTGPDPLTAALMRGVTVYGDTASGVCTTVDGAAILTALATSFGPMPGMTIENIGYGACQDSGGKARGTQVLFGQTEALAAERIAVLEANIDDMNPEFYEMIFERMFEQGALDVSLTPLLMKKGRPANKLTVLASLPAVPQLSRAILQETSTFGVRVYDVWRQKLDRFMRQVETRYGVIPVKCGVLDGRTVQAAPEYDVCKRVALQQGIPLRLVYTEAARLAASWLAEPQS